jgi:nucleoside 2-deoxyribosyltransferase
MLPPGSGISSVKILEENEKAIEMCDIVVSILGCSSSFGVGYELAYARAKQKIIILYRRDTRNNLGEIAEGFWNREVRSKRAMNLTQLRDILHSIKEHARSA